MDTTIALMFVFVLSLEKYGFTEGQDEVTFTVSPQQPALPDKEVYLTCLADSFDSRRDRVEITFRSADDGHDVFIFSEGTLDEIGNRPPSFYSVSIDTEINRLTLNITIRAIQEIDIGMYGCIVRRQGRQLVSKEINVTICEQVSPPSCFLPRMSSCSLARGMSVCTASKGEIKNFICLPGIGFDSALNTLEWVERDMDGNEVLLSLYTVNNSTLLTYTFMNNVTLKCNTNIQDCGGYTLSCSIDIIVSSDPTTSSPTDVVVTSMLKTRLSMNPINNLTMPTVGNLAEDHERSQTPLAIGLGIGGGVVGLAIIIAIVVYFLRLKRVKGKSGMEDNVTMAFASDASSKCTGVSTAIPSYENSTIDSPMPDYEQFDKDVLSEDGNRLSDRVYESRISDVTSSNNIQGTEKQVNQQGELKLSFDSNKEVSSKNGDQYMDLSHPDIRNSTYTKLKTNSHSTNPNESDELPKYSNISLAKTGTSIGDQYMGLHIRESGEPTYMGLIKGNKEETIQLSSVTLDKAETDLY